jgi:hypothetical protein
VEKVVCYKCSAVTESEKIGFRQSCDNCSEDLHVCYNCEFYDENSYNECKEVSAERITVKDRSNLCDFFSPKSQETGAQKVDKKADLLAQAEALFKKKPGE